MSNIVEFFTSTGDSPWSFPQVPTPKKIGGYFTSDGGRIPHGAGTLVDNIDFPTIFASGSFIGNLKDAAVWTVGLANINAAVDGWLGAGFIGFYDDVNDRLWSWGVDTTTNPDTLYTFYITLETGAITNIGNDQFAVQPSNIDQSSGVSVFRAALSAGNFTLRFNDRTVVVNVSTGAFVSDISEINTSDTQLPGQYVTADGVVTVGKISELNNEIEITKGQQTTIIPTPDGLAIGPSGSTTTFIVWGDEVRVVSSAGNSGIVRAFARTEFDAFALALANYVGRT